MLQAYQPSEIHKVFETLTELVRSPQEFFSSVRNASAAPLLLSEGGLRRLQNLPRFSEAGRNKYDFLYLLGQFLTAVASRYDILKMTGDKELAKKIDAFYRIWGYEHMNARSLYKRFQSKSDQYVLRKLAPSLETSARLSAEIEKHIQGGQ